MSEKKEKRTFTTRLFECCGDDDLRPIMQCVYFDNGYAYAFNGYVAIKQALSYHTILEPENLDGKLLHKDSYKAAMGFEMAEATDEGINCWNENGQTAFFEFYNKGETGKYPDVDKVITKHKGLTSVSFIGFNPEQFLKLRKAMHAPDGNIRVQFTGIDSAILVDAVGIDEQEGIIMPVILNDTLF